MSEEKTAIGSKRLTPMMMQYMEVKKEHKDHLLFYRLGDFYELFFDDAQIASKELGIVLTRRGGKDKNDSVPMCGIPFHAYDNYVARLVNKGYKIAICEQVETPEQAKAERGHKAVVRRDVVRVITPGTLTEDNLIPDAMNNFLCSIAVHKKSTPSFSVAAIDISTGSFFIDSVDVKDIDNVLSKLDPREIIVADNLIKAPELFEIFATYKQKLSIIPQSRFDLNNSREYIMDVFKTSHLEVLGEFTEADIIACGSIVDYIKLTQKDSLPKLSAPKRLRGKNIVEIDSATRRNLELNFTMSGEKNGSLFATINKTRTAGGQRLLSMYLNNPLTNKDIIDERLLGVEFFYNNPDFLGVVSNRLNGFTDLERTLNRVNMGRGGPRDLLSIKKAIAVAIDIKKLFSDAAIKQPPNIIKKILPSFIGLEVLYDLLESALDDDNNTNPIPLFARDGGFIKSSFNKDLEQYRNINQNAKGLIEELRTNYVESTGIKNLKIKQNNLIGYYIEINAKDTDSLDSSQFIHRQTMASGMRYTTNDLIELENKIKDSAQKELDIELLLFTNLTKDIIHRYEQLTNLAKSVAILDVISSLAVLAIENNYIKPEIKVDCSELDIKGGRHPVIENIMKKQQQGLFHANDCLLNGDDRQIALLTGPNMAGKSTYLRQNAIIVILAQIGSFVPADMAIIGIVDKIFSRVGAADDLARGHSTFMVEMIETSSILNQATPRSLVILDEVGRGTSTYDGLSIAWACLEHIHNVNKSRCIFATHYHELTKLEDSLQRLHCLTLKVEEIDKDVIFLHKIIDGKADKSYGIYVAKLAGAPSSVIERATQILEDLEKNKHKYNDNDKDENKIKNTNTTINHQSGSSIIEKEISSIDLDNLTPRQALEELYKLKQSLIKYAA